ncbi:hypothetical protein ABW636_10670 [Aquimarina sp. 2201CG1-2-11]|uniref:hypothetical protein n=1 Tax=Aquimarina discodermiae TaxID=3231043 RepID=UPI003463147C
MKPILLIMITYLCLLSSCGKESPNDKLISKTKIKQLHFNDSLNINILLDLSDRINYSNQKENDLKHVLNIAKVFKEHVSTKKNILLDDHLQLFFEPNPNPEKTDEVATQLKFGITKSTINEIEIIDKNYAEYLPKLYEWSLENPETKKGAHIWRFFKDKAKDYCLKENHRNILIILTDGYLYHKESTQKKGKRTTRINQKLLNNPLLNKPNWKSVLEKNDMGILWEKEKKLKNLEVLVLGIDKHNHKNPNAEDIIKYYWSKWFQEMGIKKYKIKSADIPTSLEGIIQDFILL